MFKLAFSTLACPDWPLDRVIEFAASAGYQGVEFRGIGPTLDISTLPEFTTRLAETRRRIQDAGLEVSGVDVSARGAVVDPGQLRACTEEVARNLGVAAGLGATYLRVFGGRVSEGFTIEALRPYLVANLHTWAEMAAQAGIFLAWETHDEWTRSDLVRSIVDEVAHPRLRVLWDLAHTWLDHRESPEAACRRLAEWTIALHVKDARLAPNGQRQHVPIGDGEVPLQTLLNTLFRRGWRGYAVFEWEKRWHPNLAPPEEILPLYIQRMRAWGLAYGA